MTLLTELNSDLVEAFIDLEDLVKDFNISYSTIGEYDPALGKSAEVTITDGWKGIQMEFKEKDLPDEFTGKTVIAILCLDADKPFSINLETNYSVTFEGDAFIIKMIKQDPSRLTYILYGIKV